MDPQRNEEVRNEALAYLVQRAGIAQTSETVHRRLNTENNFTIAEIEAALKFLEGMDFLTKEHQSLGSTLYWKATSAGVLHYERSL